MPQEPLSTVMNPLSFSISDALAGFAKSEGLMTLRDDHLSFEFQTSDSLAGLIRSKVKRIEVPLSEIAEITWKRGLFGGRLRVAFTSMQRVSAFPRSESNTVLFEIARHDRAKADQLVSEVKLALVSTHLDDMLGSLERTPSGESASAS